MSNISALRPRKNTEHDKQRWWPPALGTPATFGSSEDLRYASFPLLNRLAIERDGLLVTYDTADLQFRGVLHRGVADGSLSFLSQRGRVALSTLNVV